MERVSLAVPRQVAATARWLKRRFRAAPRTCNLLGDRDIEWSFVASRLRPADGTTMRVLDFGNGGSSLSLVAALAGADVVALDRNDVTWPYRLENLQFVQLDALECDVARLEALGKFDFIINCSSVEHVGLPGRYGTSIESSDGDLAVMARLAQLLEPNGKMLLTVPVGEDGSHPPMCRTYGRSRLPKLLSEYEIEYEGYWAKDTKNRWTLISKSEATSIIVHVDARGPLYTYYGLGCFVLRRN